MPHMLKTWTPEEVRKMNEESFLVELLDMIKFSPELSDTDRSVQKMQEKLSHVEKQIKYRLGQD